MEELKKLYERRDYTALSKKAKEMQNNYDTKRIASAYLAGCTLLSSETFDELTKYSFTNLALEACSTCTTVKECIDIEDLLQSFLYDFELKYINSLLKKFENSLDITEDVTEYGKLEEEIYQFEKDFQWFHLDVLSCMHKKCDIFADNLEEINNHEDPYFENQVSRINSALYDSARKIFDKQKNVWIANYKSTPRNNIENDFLCVLVGCCCENGLIYNRINTCISQHERHNIHDNVLLAKFLNLKAEIIKFSLELYILKTDGKKVYYLKERKQWILELKKVYEQTKQADPHFTQPELPPEEPNNNDNTYSSQTIKSTPVSQIHTTGGFANYNNNSTSNNTPSKNYSSGLDIDSEHVVYIVSIIVTILLVIFAITASQ